MTTDLQSKMLSLQKARDLRAASAYGKYHAMVTAMAAEQEVDPDQVAEILDDSNQCIEGLQSDVELLLKRRAWAEVVAKEKEAHEQAAAAELEISKLRNQQAAVNEDFVRRLREFDMRRSIALNQQQASCVATEQLKKTAWPHLKELHADIKQQMSERFAGEFQRMENAIRYAEGRAERAANDLKLAETKARGKLSREAKAPLQSAIDAATKELEELKEKQQAARVQRDEFSQKIVDIERKMLEP